MLSLEDIYYSSTPSSGKVTHMCALVWTVESAGKLQNENRKPQDTTTTTFSKTAAYLGKRILPG
jgi:hypothetical protein